MKYFNWITKLFKKKTFDVCKKCGSKDIKQVDEPNGGGIICNTCLCFERWDGYIITQKEFEEKVIK